MTKPFAQRVKETREATGLKQEAFAERLGVNQATISKWENGKHKPDTNALMRLSDFTGENWFYDYPVEAEPEPPPPRHTSDMPMVPLAGARTAMVFLLHTLAGKSDNAAQILADLVLDELQARARLGLDLESAEFRGALQYIVRRSSQTGDA
jgi:transcriptional regulator with XRE-family HTH domain